MYYEQPDKCWSKFILCYFVDHKAYQDKIKIRYQTILFWKLV